MRKDRPLYVLYRIFDAEGALLYVGATTNPATRFDAHQKQPWWIEAAHITVQHIATLDELEAAEIEAIRTERPRYNVIHSKPPTWSRKPRGPRGDGTVFQRRADGMWIGRIELAPVAGKRRTRSVSATTRHDALLKLEQLKRDLAGG